VACTLTFWLARRCLMSFLRASFTSGDISNESKTAGSLGRISNK
jgi:hypothetical protein